MLLQANKLAVTLRGSLYQKRKKALLSISDGRASPILILSN
nr:MAG TPA: putative cactin-like protein [Caudoviricetes sp.]